MRASALLSPAISAQGECAGRVVLYFTRHAPDNTHTRLARLYAAARAPHRAPQSARLRTPTAVEFRSRRGDAFPGTRWSLVEVHGPHEARSARRCFCYRPPRPRESILAAMIPQSRRIALPRDRSACRHPATVRATRRRCRRPRTPRRPRIRPCTPRQPCDACRRARRACCGRERVVEALAGADRAPLRTLVQLLDLWPVRAAASRLASLRGARNDTAARPLHDHLSSEPAARKSRRKAACQKRQQRATCRCEQPETGSTAAVRAERCSRTWSH